jgi:hypothetical protein
MRTARIACVIALTILGSSFASAQEIQTKSGFRPTAHSGLKLTDAGIARIKAMLKLTRIQEQYWPAVEAALRDIARHQEPAPAADEGQGNNNNVSVAPDRLQRLASSAMPLILTLDEQQKHHARTFARSVGLEKVAAAF